jgi:hypothetical protein
VLARAEELPAWGFGGGPRRLRAPARRGARTTICDLGRFYGSSGREWDGRPAAGASRAASSPAAAAMEGCGSVGAQRGKMVAFK